MLGKIFKDIFFARKRDSATTNANVIDLDELNCLVRGKHGWFLANRYDRYLGHALIRYGECCEIESKLLLSYLSSGDNVIEVGANIAVHTVSLARHVGPEGRVIAIEPQPHIHRVLDANLALNTILNVDTYAIGCGSRNDTMTVPPIDYGQSSEHNSGGLALAISGPGTLVRIVPLDELIKRDLPIKLLKVDVEGMELEVLEGSNELIDTQRPILYLENDRLNRRKALISWVLKKNYRIWWHLPSLFNPQNHFKEQQNIYPNIVSINMLCLPQESALQAPEGLEEVTNAEQNIRLIPGL